MNLLIMSVTATSTKTLNPAAMHTSVPQIVVPNTVSYWRNQGSFGSRERKYTRGAWGILSSLKARKPSKTTRFCWKDPRVKLKRLPWPTVEEFEHQSIKKEIMTARN